MSFTSLLFCPDEKTARVVTQVLSELDFTVELAPESFAAVQRLTEEHFHALVVDCQNEQDAALLFKAARNSAQNSGSLSVAVVEGQAGVAKAFRIGANLVLTKPVNIEQSKSTLRVARGLLKKTQTKPVSASPAASEAPPVVAAKPAETFVAKPNPEPPAAPKPSFASAASFPAISKPFTPPSAPAPAASVPFSGLVLDEEPEPVTGAADAAVLESLPEITGRRASEPAAPALLGHAEPIATSTAGQAAATAPAPEAKPPQSRPSGTSPMVTNEPIVSTGAQSTELPDVFVRESMTAPSFSSLETASNRSEGGSSRFLKIGLLLALLGAGLYYAWQQPQLRPYLQGILQLVTNHKAAPSTENPGPSADAQPVNVQPPADTVPATSTQDTQNSASAPTSASSSASQPWDSGDSTAPATSSSAPLETLEVQELPMSRDAAKGAPKHPPIVVRNPPAARVQPATQPVPPPINVVPATDSKMPDLPPVDFRLPNPAPGTIRISQGVSQGLLEKKVQPLYPSIARQLHKQGTVQVLATIDKSGTVTKVQVLSGDAMLTRAATDAVKQWKYRPYLLNGQPVEIETQITILFKPE